VLRKALKAADLPPEEAARVASTVFTYYRWLGWLENERGIEARLRRAMELAARFAKNPFSLPAGHLRAKAVPQWVWSEVPLNDPWLRTIQREPKLWLRARPGQGRALAKSLGDCKRFGEGPLADALQYTGRKDLFLTQEFQEGAFEVQDISSQAVSLICAPSPGETWWDVCAGEGGKTLHLSDLMQNKGLIRATDRAEWRLNRLKRRAARARAFNYQASVWDGGPTLPFHGLFDGVLVDAPCSGIGTWQRNPHARWTTTLEDVRELAAVQGRLLAHVARAVKPGGKLIYAVCTLAASETTAVADAFESAFPEFKPLPVSNPLIPEAPPSARIWIWPQHAGGNGMFVAVWRKEAA